MWMDYGGHARRQEKKVFWKHFESWKRRDSCGICLFFWGSWWERKNMCNWAQLTTKFPSLLLSTCISHLRYLGPLHIFGFLSLVFSLFEDCTFLLLSRALSLMMTSSPPTVLRWRLAWRKEISTVKVKLKRSGKTFFLFLFQEMKVPLPYLGKHFSFWSQAL